MTFTMQHILNWQYSKGEIMKYFKTKQSRRKNVAIVFGAEDRTEVKGLFKGVVDYDSERVGPFAVFMVCIDSIAMAKILFPDEVKTFSNKEFIDAISI